MSSYEDSIVVGAMRWKNGCGNWGIWCLLLFLTVLMFLFLTVLMVGTNIWFGPISGPACWLSCFYFLICGCSVGLVYHLRKPYTTKRGVVVRTNKRRRRRRSRSRFDQEGCSTATTAKKTYGWYNEAVRSNGQGAQQQRRQRQMRQQKQHKQQEHETKNNPYLKCSTTTDTTDDRDTRMMTIT